MGNSQGRKKNMPLAEPQSTQRKQRPTTFDRINRIDKMGWNHGLDQEKRSNPKCEYRNAKQMRMTENQNSKTLFFAKRLPPSTWWPKNELQGAERQIKLKGYPRIRERVSFFLSVFIRVHPCPKNSAPLRPRAKRARAKKTIYFFFLKSCKSCKSCLIMMIKKSMPVLLVTLFVWPFFFSAPCAALEASNGDGP